LPYRPGQAAELTRTIEADHVAAFAAATGDTNPLHFDEAFAAQTSFGRPVVHGLLTAGLISAVLGTRLPGPGCVYLAQQLNFRRPVYVGDTVTARVEVVEVRKDKPLLRLKTTCANQHGEIVLGGEALVLFQGSGSAASGSPQ